ncbi:hypothetical protein [Botrimarina hoheduenensis]|uniref:Uncharacterized protein n=1 Tax=Botrimarina hoheduenensis TaxID=2528000 RepID=A0A5C5VWY3_9BACT|nr:hypothetical protein [Botrimarina hoheduenensis]TWT43128.1 hypothetical protein Pla111_20780 [Botrimarina hoheduenensis]
MPRGKKHTAEEIIGKLREAEVHLSQGSTQEQAARSIGSALGCSLNDSIVFNPGGPYVTR